MKEFIIAVFLVSSLASIPNSLSSKQLHEKDLHETLYLPCELDCERRIFNPDNEFGLDDLCIEEGDAVSELLKESSYKGNNELGLANYFVPTTNPQEEKDSEEDYGNESWSSIGPHVRSPLKEMLDLPLRLKSRRGGKTQGTDWNNEEGSREAKGTAGKGSRGSPSKGSGPNTGTTTAAEIPRLPKLLEESLPPGADNTKQHMWIRRNIDIVEVPPEGLIRHDGLNQVIKDIGAKHVEVLYSSPQHKHVIRISLQPLEWRKRFPNGDGADTRVWTRSFKAFWPTDRVQYVGEIDRTVDIRGVGEFSVAYLFEFARQGNIKSRTGDADLLYVSGEVVPRQEVQP